MNIQFYFLSHGCLDLKPVATWEVDGAGLVTGVPCSMYLLSGSILCYQHSCLSMKTD
uniref:Uncharacterized protein n=1 Tax=Rhizophora mucronata TaxID=61149 RepID=A0A2P2KFI3_RHIMU